MSWAGYSIILVKLLCIVRTRTSSQYLEMAVGADTVCPVPPDSVGVLDEDPLRGGDDPARIRKLRKELRRRSSETTFSCQRRYGLTAVSVRVRGVEFILL